MNIAVTAVTGGLGKAIVQQLQQISGDHTIIGLARTPSKAAELGIEVRHGDYGKPGELKTSLVGVDALLLVSGNGAPESRIPLHRNVIQAAKEAGVKKIVYTSILGEGGGHSFMPIVESNRQTEADIRESGLNWVIGRNGLYIEPDLEYIDAYIKAGAIENSAGEGRAGYTSREELGYAYAKLLLGNHADQQTLSLLGEPITQAELTGLLNQIYGTELTYKGISVEAYLVDRKAALGEFMAVIISGIYNAIRLGAFDVVSDFETAAGRPHATPMEMIKTYQATHA